MALPEIRQVFTTVGLQGEVRSSVLRVKASPKAERVRGLSEIKGEVRAKLQKLLESNQSMQDVRKALTAGSKKA